MKQGWEIKKLGEVCTIGGGSTPSKTNKDFWENGAIPWFTIEDIREQGRKIRYTQKHITEKALNKTRLFPPKTTLLCCTASIGEYAISEVEITSNQQFNGIVVKDSGILNPYYIFYFAATLKEKLLKLSSKTTIDFVSTGKVKELTIPVPSLLEQGRIVGVLDAAFAKIDALKENAQKNLENTKALFQQVLKQELTPKPNWQTKKLGEVCTIVNGRNQKDVVDENGKYPIYGSGGKIMGYANSYLCPANTTIIGRKGSINNPIFVDYPFWNVDTAFGLHSNEDYNYMLLHYFCLSFDFSKLNKGTTLPSLVKSDLLKIEIPVPPIVDQGVIVSTLNVISEKCSKVIANAEKTIAECDALKQAVLRRAFNGEL